MNNRERQMQDSQIIFAYCFVILTILGVSVGWATLCTHIDKITEYEHSLPMGVLLAIGQYFILIGAKKLFKPKKKTA